jgi:hypothetical protein
MTYDEIAMEFGMPKSSLHLILIEVLERGKVTRCLLHDNARPDIAQTVFTDYKLEVLPGAG